MRHLCRGIFWILLLACSVAAQSWPDKPPPIGNLYLKQEYWEYMKEAARKYKISPFLIQAVCAIESRFDPEARSGRCIGLMQLHVETARVYGVNPFNPRENIMGGAAVLAKFMARYNGDIPQVLRRYNATATSAYIREVLRAYEQALNHYLLLLACKGKN